MPRLEKRSLAIAGHRTSVALEPEFWAALEHIASARGVNISTLIVRIDSERAEQTPDRPLASACRVYALRQRDP